MNRNLIIVVVVAVVLIGGGFLFLNSRKSNQVTTPATQTPTTQTPVVTDENATGAATAQQEMMVTISGDGFSPKEVNIKVGETVSWLNSDTKSHDVSSDTHPTHTLFPPLNTIGMLKANEKRSLMFPEKGTYKYHDHLNPQLTGTVVVE